MTDQDPSTENSDISCQEGSSSRLDDVIQREVHPVQKRDRRLAQWFILVVCLVLVLLVCGLFIDRSIFFQPVQKPGAQMLFQSERIPVPERLPRAVVQVQDLSIPATIENEPVKDEVAKLVSEVISAAEKIPEKTVANADLNDAEKTYDVIIGPFITKSRLHEGEAYLKAKGLLFVSEAGSGPITMMRLREGVYAPDVARKRLAEMVSAGFRDSFVLPAGDMLAVYAGSFVDQNRADMLSQDLAQKNITVVQVDAEMNKQGRILRLKDISEPISIELEKEFSDKGIHVQKNVVK